MIEKVKIIGLKNGMIVIGVPQYTEGKNAPIGISKPLQLTLGQNGNVGLLELFGAPDVITLFDSPIYVGDCNDKDMSRTYLKATTTLHLPN
jgi:hypothetical protein